MDGGPSCWGNKWESGTKGELLGPQTPAPPFHKNTSRARIHPPPSSSTWKLERWSKHSRTPTQLHGHQSNNGALAAGDTPWELTVVASPGMRTRSARGPALHPTHPPPKHTANIRSLDGTPLHHRKQRFTQHLAGTLNVHTTATCTPPPPPPRTQEDLQVVLGSQCAVHLGSGIRHCTCQQGLHLPMGHTRLRHCPGLVVSTTPPG
jgi:hypothetical protein